MEEEEDLPESAKNPADERRRKLQRLAGAGDEEAAERLRKEERRLGAPSTELMPWIQPVDIPLWWLMYLGSDCGDHNLQGLDGGGVDWITTAGSDSAEAVVEAVLHRDMDEIRISVVIIETGFGISIGVDEAIDGTVLDLGPEDDQKLRVRIVPSIRSNPGWWRAVHQYVSPRRRALTDSERLVREIAYRIKDGDKEAIDVAARLMSQLVPSGAVIVPAPGSRHGSFRGIDKLAQKIADLTNGVMIPAVVRTRSVESSRDRRVEGHPGLGPDAHRGSMKLVRRLDSRVPVVIVDNVAATGATLESVRELMSPSVSVSAVVWAQDLDEADRPLTKNSDEKRRKIERAAARGDDEAAQRRRVERKRAGEPPTDLVPWVQPVEIPLEWLDRLGPHDPPEDRNDVDTLDSRITRRQGGVIEAALVYGSQDTYIRIWRLSDDWDENDDAANLGGFFDYVIDGQILDLPGGHRVRVQIVPSPRSNGRTSSLR